ncbi:hypothetical protein HAV22_05255 [Massilia sp. TW-1]|uniref:Uncharacterized protein n=1 Tax=Telluria antibiotica TaxID=2717319 RepID=A0ABX0P735_9BURK|nr:hypothetical protein [Telluria antibiotica]NIA53062.1 hypothetical protein [Telluria antibiotica]
MQQSHFKVSGPAPSPTTVELATKMGYRVSDRLQVGIERYDEFGDVRHPDNPFRGAHTAYAVVDTTLGGWDLNLGVGRGSVAASDRWVLKAIVGVPF